MGVPGEDLPGSHPATEFVAWYNGHPDYVDCRFDLAQERVAVVGVGNVAVDVARILCRTPEELARTDIADHALEALRHSRVREVYLLGRRGPAQAAFTNPEVRELGELPGADVAALPEEVALDPLTRAALEKTPDRPTTKKVEILQEFARRTPAAKPRRLVLRFLVSPVEVVEAAGGGIGALRLVRNELTATAAGTLQARPTGQVETLPVGLVFRSVGYRGVALPGFRSTRAGASSSTRRAGCWTRRASDHPRRVRRGVDQAGANRGHRHQQAGRRRDGRRHAGGRRPRPRPGPGSPRAGGRRGARPRAPAPGRLLRRLAPARRDRDRRRPRGRAGLA